MEDLLEPERKAQVNNQAGMIECLLSELQDQPRCIEYLKTGNYQARMQDWSPVDIGIEVPSLEEMNKLNLKAQIELQGRLIDTLMRAVEPGRKEIPELQRQDRQRKPRVNTTLAQPFCDDGRRKLDAADRDARRPIEEILPGSPDESGWRPQIRELVGSRLDSSRSLASQ
jgi:hypothetical protein